MLGWILRGILKNAGDSQGVVDGHVEVNRVAVITIFGARWAVDLTFRRLP